MTALTQRIARVLDSWPAHDVVACKRLSCPDCAVEACRYDIETALEDGVA